MKPIEGLEKLGGKGVDFLVITKLKEILDCKIIERGDTFVTLDNKKIVETTCNNEDVMFPRER